MFRLATKFLILSSNICKLTPINLGDPEYLDVGNRQI